MNKSNKKLNSIDFFLNKKNKNIFNSNKIYKGTNFPPFLKKNFGSIPTKNDSFLFKFSKKQKSLFNSKSDYFDKNYLKNKGYLIKGDNIQFIFNDLQSTNYSSEEIISNNQSLNNSFINKVLNLKNNNNNIFIKNTKKNQKKIVERFDDNFYRNEENKKYYPGPCEYDPYNLEKSYIYRYNSLFKKKNNFSINRFNDLYESKILEKKDKKNNVKKSFSSKNIIFGKEKKFCKFNSPFPINFDEEKIGPGLFNFPSSFKIPNKNKNSYFFLTGSKKDDDNNLEKKYIQKEDIKNFDEDKNYIKFKDKIKMFNIDNKIKKQILINKIKEEEEKEKINREKKRKIIEINELKNYFFNIENNDKKGFTFTKIKKGLKFPNYHIPGPCYYNFENILNSIKSKRNFHSNIKKIWV